MRGHRFCRTTLAILVGHVLAAGTAQAATFTVTNPNDSGPGSLRQAVLDANAAAGADNIVFDPGLQGSTITLTSGEISITEDLTVTGPLVGNPAGITIDGDSSSQIFNNPAFCTYTCGGPPPTALVTLENLTLKYGYALESTCSGGAVRNCGDVVINDSVIRDSRASCSGGGIYARHGSVVITNSEVSGNSASSGGGIFAGDGSVVITNSEVSGNSASYGSGGGVNAQGNVVTVTNSTITDNTVEGELGGGGGIIAETVDVVDSTISGNTVNGDGGGINSIVVTLNKSNVSNNLALGDGGGILGTSTVALTDSTVSGNWRMIENGELRPLHGGGIAGFEVTLTRSTVSNNRAVNDGGGIFSYSVDLTGSTVSNNHAGSTGGGIQSLCGGVVLTDSTVSNNMALGGGGVAVTCEGPALNSVTVTNSTVSGNSATGNEVEGIGFGGMGGGIAAYQVVLDNSTVTENSAEPYLGASGEGGGILAVIDAVLRNSVVAANTATVGPDISCPSVSGDFNLFLDPAVIISGTGNILGEDSLLAPLAFNGGVTQTHALLSGSPAIDAGDPNFVPPPDFDQRGSPYDRVQGGRLDIGAYETQPTGSIEFASATAAFNEETGTVTVSVLRTDASISELTATVTSASGTATQGVDFQAVNQTLTFAEGVTEQTVNVTLIDDADCEGDETFQLNLSGESIGATSTMTVTIVDDVDLASAACQDTLAFSQPAYTVGETSGDAVLVVRRQGPAQVAAEVAFATLDGSALSPEDYTATAGSLSWPEGDTSDREIRVPIIDDILIEGDEQFQVALSDPLGADLDPLLATASVTILDNEIADTVQTLQFALGGDRVINEGESLTGSIERVGGSSGAVSVNIGTFNRDAMAGEDYQAQVTVLRWADGELGTKSFTVTTIDDTEPEGDESFVVALTNPVQAELNTEAQQITVTLRDNDVAPLGGVVRMVTPTAKAFVTADGTEVTVRRVNGSAGAADAMLLVTPIDSDRVTARVPVSWEEGESGVRTVMLPRAAFDAALGDHFTVTLEGDSVAVSGTSGAMTLSVVGRETVSEDTSTDDGGGGGALGPWSLLLMALAPLVGRLRRRYVRS